MTAAEPGPSLVGRFAEKLQPMLGHIEALVTCESPSADLAAVARSADIVATLGASVLGAAPERITADGRAHLRWRFGAGPTRVLLVGHHDTVWPLGSLRTHPFSVHDGILRGPGCFDMKAGLVIAFHALTEVPDLRGVTLLITGDEEIGSPSSRELIESEASRCRAALILEPAAPGGRGKTERKGMSIYELVVTGRAAHAGLEPNAGVNATIEIAHQILTIATFADSSAGTSVTPTVLTAGVTSNTVPAAGRLFVDVRAASMAEQARVDAAIRALRPVLDGSSLTVTGGINRPPLETSASSGLLVRTAMLAEALGLGPLGSASVGGGSDGNFTAGLGIPTLDGLGAVGDGAHADHEHVLVAELAGRTALVAALVADQLAIGP